MRNIGIAIFLSLLAACACGPRVLPDRDVYRAGLDSLVDVVVFHDHGLSLGSGAVIGEDAAGRALILTARHVADKATAMVVRPSLDLPHALSAPTCGAELVRLCVDCDLALLRAVCSMRRSPLSIAVRAPVQADPIFYFGNADETPTVFGRGLITRLHYPGAGHDGVMQIGGFTWPGMSGGPVLDERGQLVGVIVMRNVVDDPDYDEGKTTTETVGYAEGRDAVVAFLRRAGAIR